MAKLTILEYPDPRLRTRAVPVAAVDDTIRALIDDMLETMYAAPGIGLAATQVNVHKRVLVVDVTESRTSRWRFVNPEIIEREGKAEAEEGCLSVPGIFDNVERAPSVSSSVRSTATASRSNSRPTACSPCASSTRWITWRASCSSITCPSSSARRIRKKLEKERRERGTAEAGRERSKVPVI